MPALAKSDGDERIERMLQRWLTLGMRLLLRRADIMPAGVLLIEAYTESRRRYHNLEHIESSLRHMDAVVDRLDQPALVELALWFHDVIYDVGSKDNEHRSAEYAIRVLGELGLASDQCSLVAAMILATKHDQPTPLLDGRMLCDIDLAILAAPASEYDRYRQAIREEAGLSREVFNPLRLTFLRSMLARPTIYHTDGFIAQWERAARRNLQQEADAIQQVIAGDTDHAAATTCSALVRHRPVDGR